MGDCGTIVVTGGGRGIGAAIARRLARDGYAVLLNYTASADRAEAVAAEIVASGGQASICRADVADAAAVSAMFERVDQARAPLVGLVNNAGILGGSRRIDEHDAGSLQAILATNVLGPMLCAREAVRRMSRSHGGAGGAIVNIGSIAGSTGGIPGLVPYSASKGAVASFTIALAKEVAREGIRVNAVAPGIVATDMTAGFAEGVGQLVPAGRCGDPDEIAAAVSWLLSDEASYVSGTVLNVSGG